MSVVVQAIVSSTPSAPSGLLATPVSNTTVSLTWSASTSGGLPIQNYRVFRGTTSSNLSQVATVVQPPYTDASGSSATIYYYAVQSTDTGGDLSALSATVSATTLELPSAPTGLIAIPASNTKVSLAWNVPPVLTTQGGIPLASYRVYRGNSLSTLLHIQVVATTPTVTTDNTVTPDTTYYYGIQAIDTGGNTSTMSDLVEVVTPATPAHTVPFHWPASNIYDGVLVSVNQYCVTYIVDHPSWFAHLGLATSLQVNLTKGNAAAEAIYTQTLSSIQQYPITVGVYVDGISLVPEAEET